MNLQAPSASGSGFSQPGSDMGQLPPIHTPEAFRAPDAQIPHFAAAEPQLPAAPPVVQPANPIPLAQPSQSPASVAGPTSTVLTADAQALLAQGTPAAPAEEPDTALDEEWVGKARKMIEQLHADPFLASKELSKLKAQYIKARYNKDIKVSEG